MNRNPTLHNMGIWLRVSWLFTWLDYNIEVSSTTKYNKLSCHSKRAWSFALTGMLIFYGSTVLMVCVVWVRMSDHCLKDNWGCCIVLDLSRHSHLTLTVPLSTNKFKSVNGYWQIARLTWKILRNIYNQLKSYKRWTEIYQVTSQKLRYMGNGYWPSPTSSYLVWRQAGSIKDLEYGKRTLFVFLVGHSG